MAERPPRGSSGERVEATGRRDGEPSGEPDNGVWAACWTITADAGMVGV